MPFQVLPVLASVLKTRRLLATDGCGIIGFQPNNDEVKAVLLLFHAGALFPTGDIVNIYDTPQASQISFTPVILYTMVNHPWT